MSNSDIKFGLLGGIRTANLSRAGLAELMREDVLTCRSTSNFTPKVIISSNGSVIARYNRDKSFKDILDCADLIDADGMSLVFASQLYWDTPLSERVATTDFIHDAARCAIETDIRFFFLGGHPGVAEKAAKNLVRLHPGLKIAGCRDGYFDKDQIPEICRQIEESGAEIIWLGLGSPRQEQLAMHLKTCLNKVAWIHTCGGLFDHKAGLHRRAPKWIQSIGFEWLYRMILEPWRLGPRYLKTNGPALYYLLTNSTDKIY